jgi:hypothetical protein
MGEAERVDGSGERLTARCGHVPPQGLDRGEPCCLRPGHAGTHRSAKKVERYLAQRRERFATDAECRARIRAQNMDRYRSLTGYEYNKLLLRHRRNQAIIRRRARHTTTGEVLSGTLS